MGFLTWPASAQVQDLSYTISPASEYVLWSGNAGLDNGLLYGGRLGFGFGRYMEVSGVYLTGTGFETNTDGFSGLSEDLRNALSQVAQRSVDVQRYGGDLKFNLYHGTIVPFIKAGAGILAFNPEGLPSSRRIYLNNGVGIQVGTPYRFKLTLQAENMAYRYNAGTSFFSQEDLVAVGLESANFNQVSIRNWAFGAGLQLYLGGQRPGTLSEIDRALQDQLRGGFQGISFPIEPFVGRVDFSDALGYASGQRVGGVYSGLDLGPYIGIRGFYWRALADGSVSDFEPLQSYGGEVRMRLNAGRQGIQPYLTLGGGYLDVLGGYEARDGRQAKDEPYASTGIGIHMPIGDAVQLSVSARSLLISNQASDEVAAPSEVKTNYMYSAGLSFSLGGSRRSAGSVLSDEMASIRAEAETREAILERELARTNARLDSLSRAMTVAQQRPPADSAAVRAVTTDSMSTDVAGSLTRMATDSTTTDSTAFVQPEAQQTPASRAAKGTPAKAQKEQQFVTLPIPEEGEIYIRFGRPGGVSIETFNANPPQSVLRTDSTATRVDSLAASATPSTSAAGQPVGNSQDATGSNGPLTAEQIRQIVAETLQEAGRLNAANETQRRQQEAASDEQMREILNERLDAMEERFDQRLRAAQDAARAEQPVQQPVTVITPAPQTLVPQNNLTADSTASDTTNVLAVDSAARVEPPATPRRYQFSGLVPLSGYQTGQGRDKGVVALRADYRSNGTTTIRWAPELSVGIGKGDTITLLGVSAIKPLGLLGEAVVPYVGAGPSLLVTGGFDDVQATLNLQAGLERLAGRGAFVLEYQTLDFFDFSRFLLGYRILF